MSPLPYRAALFLAVCSFSCQAKDADITDLTNTKELGPCEQIKYIRYSQDGSEVQNPSGVIQKLSECLAVIPNAPANTKAAALTLRSIAYAQRREYGHAIKDREEALLLAPARSAWAIIGLAALYRENGQPEQALKMLQKMLQDNIGMTGKGTSPGMPSYYHLGVTLISLKRWPDAAEALSEGMSYQSNYLWAYAYRALAYDQMGLSSFALADMEKVRLLVNQKKEDDRSKTLQLLSEEPFAEIKKKYMK
ncbi:tetratricopeptide repeat protein [Azospira inquinata]|uniref:Tetratricopeptide repeat protein n=1 Tax=Azospira inquinata TaxID=2785627 RepID=A0A975XTN2_9RHOO|nr:hypothetical protein [Azospira inquinata]QWT46782.1 hypothetical protein J8L76_03475 [Azospira inquinata]QWT47895.1 hypothetical protein Azoinq_08390 [Azospira inquinata]